MEDEKMTNNEGSFSLKMKKRLWGRHKPNPYQWDFHDEEGREQIHQWSKSRQQKFRGINKTYRGFLVYTFSLNTMKSFVQNVNFMVVIQMMLAGISIYLFQTFNIYFDIHVSLFVSPIVFPLAFSINTDFQRREKVLEDLANFKSSGMLWFFCMREWKETSGLDEDWMNAVHSKLKSLLFHLREYLLTGRVDRRKVILNAMYEDLSDCSQLIEKVRASQLPANAALISRIIHLVQMMSLSFERLRVVREYRSPRSIRAFNKVLILFLPIILGPYFVYQSRDRSGKIVRAWTPYYISILVSFVFSALQGVQDKLDDPFDGMSEDDINLEQIDEWTFHSLQATVNRTFQVGRFHVNIDRQDSVLKPAGPISVPPTQPVEQTDSVIDLRRHISFKRRVSNFLERSGSMKRSGIIPQESMSFEPGLHPYAEVLEKISGNTRIEKGGSVRPASSESSTSMLKSLDSFTDTLSSFPSNKVSVVPLDEKQPRVMTLENLFQNQSSDNGIDVTKRTPRKISFNQNPEILSPHTPYADNSYENLNTPLLSKSRNSQNARFKLTHMERISSSTSDPLIESPKTSASKSARPSETMVEILENHNNDEEYEMQTNKVCSHAEDQDFVVIESSTNESKEKINSNINDVFI